MQVFERVTKAGNFRITLDINDELESYDMSEIEELIEALQQTAAMLRMTSTEGGEAMMQAIGMVKES